MNRKSIGFLDFIGDTARILVFARGHPYGMDEQNVGEMFSSPSRSHFLVRTHWGEMFFGFYLAQECLYLWV